MKSYIFCSALLATLTAACSAPSSAPETETADTPPTAQVATPDIDVAPTDDPFTAIMNGEWRSEGAAARDVWRNPEATLAFFEIAPSDTVIEIWPGGGWYTDILAPYLASGDGTLIAALWDINAFEGERRDRIATRIDEFKANYAANPEVFGQLQYSAFSAESAALAEADSVDAVLTFRNVHNWMAQDYEAKFFADAYAALKPGGVLGVVEHRLPSSQAQEPRATSGYVHEDYVKALANDAGFEFVASSEINANPKDTADHPFGVWTLPPSARTTDRDGNAPADFDPAVYTAIGESDRMTLKFSKPIVSD